MLSQVKESLLALQQKQKLSNITVDGYSDFIFLNSQNKLYTPCTINNKLKNIIKKCNEEQLKKRFANSNPNILPNFSIHVFRHTFCTRFCEIENNLKVIQTVMGHVNIQITMDIYTDITKQKMQETFQNIENKLEIY